MTLPPERASQTHRRPTTLPSILLTTASAIIYCSTIAIIAIGGNGLPVASADASLDYFCGTKWIDASNTCRKHCPTGTEEECIDALGAGYDCFDYTGCRAKIDSGEMVDPDFVVEGEEEFSVVMGGGGDGGIADFNSVGEVTNGNFCGISWANAMRNCNAPCPNGLHAECGQGEECFAATNCDRPLETLEADMLVTLVGADTTMQDEDEDIFGGTIYDILALTVEDIGVALNQVRPGRQEVSGRRQLERRYRHRTLKGWLHEDSNMKIIMVAGNNITQQRKLPTGSSALDVSMVITGDYRPPPYVDLNLVVEDSINRQGAKLVSTMRERGEMAGRSFFERVEGIEALARSAVTPRPTREPTPYPTRMESEAPSEYPSFPPTYYPTQYPTQSPSRSHDQVILTGSQEDLTLGGTTTSSFGYIFNMRTRPNTGVVIVNGFELYTESTEDVTFELWTRLGNFQGFKGKFDGWDLIAAGSVKGRGLMRYTEIPEEMLTPVSIPGGGGDGGTRAFYLTCDKKDLIYKTAVGEASDAFAHYSNEDVEIWEGEGVLYNWDMEVSPDQEKLYYRFPRQYLGVIRYDRLPCAPFDVYGLVSDLPCPRVPTGAPTVPPPTRTPVTASPSRSPTPAPIGTPTVGPTISRAPVAKPTGTPTIPHPTMSPTTAEPSFSPVIPKRANVISVFRNVPDRDMTDREIEKFLEVITAFLRRHTEITMVIDGVDLWHHKRTAADAGEGSLTHVSRQGSRGILEKKKGHAEEASVPQVTAVEITMILRISNELLPLNMLGNLAAVEIDENQAELLSLLNGLSVFYSYFEKMDSVQSHAVEYVTNPPTMAPASPLTSNGLLSDVDDEPEEDKKAGFIVAVALTVAGLWCCLTIVSISFLMRRRAQMQEEHHMEDLLRQEKIGPMENDEADVIWCDDDESSKNQHPLAVDTDEEDPSGSNIEELDGSHKSKASSTGSPRSKARESQVSGTTDPSMSARSMRSNSSTHSKASQSLKASGTTDPSTSARSMRSNSSTHSKASQSLKVSGTTDPGMSARSMKSNSSTSQALNGEHPRSRIRSKRSGTVSRLESSFTSLSSSAASEKSESSFAAPNSNDTVNRKFPVRSSRQRSTQTPVPDSSSSVAASRASHSSQRSLASQFTQSSNAAGAMTASSNVSINRRGSSTSNQSGAGRGRARVPSSRQAMPNASKLTGASSVASRTSINSSAVRMPSSLHLNPNNVSNSMAASSVASRRSR